VAHDHPVIPSFRPDGSSVRPPAILLTSYMTGAARGKNLGIAGYSYDIVTKLFLPLLERWGQVIPVPFPRRDLDAVAESTRRRGLQPIHVSFRPFQDVHLARSVPNVVVPAWEFPDIPDYPFGGNPQNDWPATANRCSLVVVGGPFTQRALLKAGTQTPVRIVQVPTPHEYFNLPRWDPDTHTVIDCSPYEFRRPEVVSLKTLAPGKPAAFASTPFPPPARQRRISNRGRFRPALESVARRVYKGTVRPFVSQRLARTISGAWQGAKKGWQNPVPAVRQHIQGNSQLDLSGIVYTSILNPIDGRKNWQDLLTSFLFALRDCEDATLVVKLITSNPDATDRVLNYYKLRDIPHRCKLVFIAEYLSDKQLLQLAEASTYYLQATRAEGNCLPLMNYLAAARPGISPMHSAVGDYFDDEIGYVVQSHPEPSAWPHDRWLRIRTTWGRIVWPSLVDQIRKSYLMAKVNRRGYDVLADRGRERMLHWANPDSVWPRLKSALDLLIAKPSTHEDISTQELRAA